MIEMNKPLAQLMAPQTMDDILGQKHLLGKGKVLRNLVNKKKLFSMILFGKPGIGKTSIAQAIVNDLGVRYRFLNATMNNKKDFDIVVEEAKMYDGIVLIMDEIHRLNKDKQDLLLPCLESGLITLIGMTTANPYHAINPAIRSRCQLFELHDLEPKDIKEGLEKALQSPYIENMTFDKDAIDYIVQASGSDLRFAYNLLEISAVTTNQKNVTKEFVEEINHRPVFFHDKDGDGYYDALSAFQKSIRGSDVDAAMHYLARLIQAGDLESIFRRMAVIAYEDIGLANPSIGPKVMAAIEAAKLVGLPEARIPLGTVVAEMALSPKSNSAIMAIDEALNDVEQGNVGSIPKHIRNGSPDYQYPHHFKGGYVKQQYLPNQLKNKKYYHPKDLGYEQTLKQVYEKLEKIKNNNN